MLLPCLITMAALAVVLWAEAREHGPLIRIAKPIASTGFILAALSMDALDSAYGTAVLCALVLSWVGDVCLLSRRQGWFLAGLGAFLFGHVAFGVAFWVHGTASAWFLGTALALLAPALVVRHWLTPHVPSGMRKPVDAYIMVITVMVALAVAATAQGGTVWIAIGAVAFYLSDLSVARDRFVRREYSNRLWGLPLYYVAQLILAATIGA
ncbi:MAG: lysoplasmalogenase [Myxococcota bacterium]